MTVSAAPALAGPFDGNNVATTFPFDFKIFAESDLRVVLRDALTAEYLLTLGVDYSVSMNPDQNADPGGSITYPLSGSPLATGERLTITTDLELSQQTVFTNLGKFFPATVEDTFDRLTMLLRQIQAESARAIRVPVSLSDVLTDLPTPVRGAGLVWNEDGTALVNGIPSESLVAISSFMANVIQAVDAAEARSDIGAAADTAVVKLTGAQTVAGVKTFSDKPIIPDATAAQNPVSKAQLDAETAARTAAIAAAVLPSTLAPTLFVGSASVSLSGSNVDFTAIPSWVKRVTITLSGASTNGTVVPFIQLGTGAGPTWDTTSTYKGSGFGGSSGASPGVNLNTSGFNLKFSTGAAEVWHATIILTRHDSASNTWSLLSVGSNETAVWTAGGGSKALSAPLTSVRLSCGANSFDAGTASVVWE